MSRWAEVQRLNQADLERRLQQCREDLDQLDRMLEQIGDRVMLSTELPGDQEQITRIRVLVDAIGQQVLTLRLIQEAQHPILTEQVG